MQQLNVLLIFSQGSGSFLLGGVHGLGSSHFSNDGSLYIIVKDAPDFCTVKHSQFRRGIFEGFHPDGSLRALIYHTPCKPTLPHQGIDLLDTWQRVHRHLDNAALTRLP